MPATALSRLVPSGITVSVRSQLTPPIVLDPTAPAGTDPGTQSGFGNWIMDLIKPAIYVDTPAGTVKAEPWGTPSTNYLPALIVVGSVFVLAGLGLAYAFGKRSG